MQAATFLAEKKREKGRESAEDRCSLQILYFTDMDVTMSANRSLLVRKIVVKLDQQHCPLVSILNNAMTFPELKNYRYIDLTPIIAGYCRLSCGLILALQYQALDVYRAFHVDCAVSRLFLLLFNNRHSKPTSQPT